MQLFAPDFQTVYFDWLEPFEKSSASSKVHEDGRGSESTSGSIASLSYKMPSILSMDQSLLSIDH